MSITCPNCGKTNIPTGTTLCPVCSKVLPLSSSGFGGSITSSVTRPQLVDSRGRRYNLNPTSPAVIGSRGCAVLLSDPGIPTQAARITPNGGGFFLEDISGAVKVNGVLASNAIALQPGDKITIGGTVLVYQGPAAPPTPPIAPIIKISPPTTKAVVTTPPLPPPVSVGPVAPTGIALKSWGSNPPIVEGYIELVDGPHRVEKGSMGVKVATSLALSLISSTLAMLPFWMKQEVNVWFLRIKEHSSGRMVSVVMRGEPGSLPQLGDFIAIWGIVKDGNVIMQRGYSYTTNSEIRLKG